MFKTYSVQEVAELTGINRHYFKLMNQLGILKGIQTGKGRRYSDMEVQEFWERYKDGDFSNPERIRLTALMKQKNG